MNFCIKNRLLNCVREVSRWSFACAWHEQRAIQLVGSRLLPVAGCIADDANALYECIDVERMGGLQQKKV
jgi:hypothetical protein